MRRPIAMVGAVGALALGGTAIAVADRGGLPLLGGHRDHRDSELAEDLASKLDGVSASEVRRALEEVRHERRAERRGRLAAALARELNVGREEAERALQKAHDQAVRDWRRHRHPRPRRVVSTLAEELDRSRADVRRALREVRREHVRKMFRRHGPRRGGPPGPEREFGPPGADREFGPPGPPHGR
jgi:hypothetical protein